GADTIVVLNNEIINKPKDENDAFQILNKLSNRSHFVYTGIALINTQNNKMLVDYSRTCVYFREIDKEEILEYIADGKTLDKAGSYGIQDDYGALFVRKIEGCYNNVLGLPIELLRRRLLEIID
ncbi:MAG: septum formation protein Maf, partial [Bacteroidetes bacterium]|nr:septum formation protein Maf [Bacteroidota bacterium]